MNTYKLGKPLRITVPFLLLFPELFLPKHQKMNNCLIGNNFKSTVRLYLRYAVYYSITVESTVMNASGYGENDHAGDDLGGGNEYGL